MATGSQTRPAHRGQQGQSSHQRRPQQRGVDAQNQKIRPRAPLAGGLRRRCSWPWRARRWRTCRTARAAARAQRNRSLGAGTVVAVAQQKEQQYSMTNRLTTNSSVYWPILMAWVARNWLPSSGRPTVCPSPRRGSSTRSGPAGLPPMPAGVEDLLQIPAEIQLSGLHPAVHAGCFIHQQRGDQRQRQNHHHHDERNSGERSKREPLPQAPRQPPMHRREHDCQNVPHSTAPENGQRINAKATIRQRAAAGMLCLRGQSSHCLHRGPAALLASSRPQVTRRIRGPQEVRQQLGKLHARVRFPSPAPIRRPFLQKRLQELAVGAAPAHRGGLPGNASDFPVLTSWSPSISGSNVAIHVVTDVEVLPVAADNCAFGQPAHLDFIGARDLLPSIFSASTFHCGYRTASS